MKKLLTLLLFSNIVFSLLQAQPVHQIKGTVIEKNSRQPLEFINVMVLGLNKGGVTNAEGHFTIEQVPPGIYRLQATAIGYKSVTTPEYILSTKNLNISIEMEENLTELAGVTVTASPYTPYDEEKSSLVSAWDAQGKAYYDYSKYNKERLPAFAQVDLRIDKIFYLKHCMLGFYLDLQNITVSKLEQQDVLMSTSIIKNPEAPAGNQHYKMKSIKQSSGTLLPTLGITFEY